MDGLAEGEFGFPRASQSEDARVGAFTSQPEHPACQISKITGMIIGRLPVDF